MLGTLLSLLTVGVAQLFFQPLQALLLLLLAGALLWLLMMLRRRIPAPAKSKKKHFNKHPQA